jgi:hypothetical protein
VAMSSSRAKKLEAMVVLGVVAACL